MAFDKTIPVDDTTAFADPIRGNFNALATTQKGSAAPADPELGYFWWDDSDSTNEQLKCYSKDGAAAASWKVIFNHMESAPIPAKSSGVPVLSGRWYNACIVLGTQDVPTALEMSCYPIVLDAGGTFDRVACSVGPAGKWGPGPGAPGDLARLGIYEDDGSGVPGALIVDAGTASISVSGTCEAVISTALSAGLYWLAMVVNNTGAGFTRASYANADVAPNFGRLTPGSAIGQQGYLGVIPSFAALPDPAPAMTFADVNTGAITMILRAE